MGCRNNYRQYEKIKGQKNKMSIRAFWGCVCSLRRSLRSLWSESAKFFTDCFAIRLTGFHAFIADDYFLGEIQRS